MESPHCRASHAKRVRCYRFSAEDERHHDEKSLRRRQKLLWNVQFVDGLSVSPSAFQVAPQLCHGLPQTAGDATTRSSRCEEVIPRSDRLAGIVNVHGALPNLWILRLSSRRFCAIPNIAIMTFI